jgi:hypothetical protein
MISNSLSGEFYCRMKALAALTGKEHHRTGIEGSLAYLLTWETRLVIAYDSRMTSVDHLYACSLE